MFEKIRLHEKPSLKNPVMVAGLPGSGYVGKLAVDHLNHEFGGKLFAELYSESFPPQVVIRRDGSSSLIKNELYYGYLPDLERHVIVYTGDAQPASNEAQYEVADTALEVAQSLGADSIYSLAAYIIGGFAKKPAVYGTATDPLLIPGLEAIGIKPMSEGNITGVNGLVIGLAKLRNMRGYCLLAETSGYIVDAAASQAVLDALSRLLSFRVNLTLLEERAKETATIIQTMQEMHRRREQEKTRGSDRGLGYIS